MINKKVLFIQPTIYDGQGKLTKKNKLYFVGLGFPLLAALTPSDWECEICLETIEDIPFDTDAHVIAIGGMGHAVVRTIEIIQEYRKRGKIIIVGGPMVSLVPEEAKQYADAVVIGDAEGVWENVLRDIEINSLKSFYEKKLDHLSTPIPRYDLILNKKIGDFLPVQAGRGCPNSCSFCSIYCIYRNTYLRRDIDEVIRDIKHVESLGFKKFLLLDDNILSDPDYFIELANEIKKLNMQWLSQCSILIAKNPKVLKAVAESGCVALSFGLESISKESLKVLNKTWEDPDEYGKLIDTIVEAGIDVSTEMIVGADGDTKESIVATADFIRNNKIFAPKFYILTPIPGTDFYYEMQKQGRIFNKNIYSYSPSKASITPLNMSAEELDDLYWELYNRVYTMDSILKRTIMHKYFFKDPKRYIFNFIVNMYYRYQIKHRIAPIVI